MTWSPAAKLRCVERELKLRYRVYRRRVAAGDMSKAQADHEISLMEEIAADYRAQIERGRESEKPRAML